MIDPDENGKPVTLAQRMGLGFNAMAGVVALFAILAMLNYLAARHYRRFDWAGFSVEKLSPETTRLLQSLTNDVRVTVFFDADPERPVYSMVQALLQTYKDHSPRIKLDQVNYIRDTGKAKQFKSKYLLSNQKDQDLVLFECDGRTKTVFASELSDYDYSGLVAGQTNEVTRTSFKGELLFSAAILNVFEARQAKAYFLTGHDEHDPDNVGATYGYSTFASLLRQKNVTIDKLNLLGTNEVPADCQLLIIAGPQKALLDSEVDRIEKYLNQGGRAMILMNTVQQVGKRIGLERMLLSWGVTAGYNEVKDPEAGVNEYSMKIQGFSAHPTVAPLAAIYLLLPRSIEKSPNNQNTPDAPKVESIAFTGKNAYRMSEIKNGRAERAKTDKEESISVAVAVEKGGIKGVAADHGTTRMVIVGDSFCFGNGTIDQAANADFATLSASWLLDRNYMLGGIGPHPIKYYKVMMTDSDMNRVRLLLLAGLPGGVIVIGTLVWIKRRS